MTFPRIPSLALLLLGTAISLSFSTELRAGASNKNGNPFSANGTQFPNGGTFTAIFRGQNLVGVTQFSTFGGGSDPVLTSGWNMLNGSSANGVGALATNTVSDHNTNSIPGFVSIYYNGTTYNGPAFSILNMAANEIASVFYSYDAGGQAFDPGSGSTLNQSGPILTSTNTVLTTNVVITTTNYTQSTTTVTFVTNAGVVTTNIVTQNNTIYTNVGFTNIVPVSTNQSLANAAPIPVYAGSYNYYDGNWTATFKNQYPNQTFSGTGVISLGQPANASNPSPINQPNGGSNIVQISYKVTGTRVNASQSSIY